MMDLNKLPPDPAWDYCSVWLALVDVVDELDETLLELQDLENSTEENDRSLLSGLDNSIAALTKVRSQIRPYPVLADS